MTESIDVDLVPRAVLGRAERAQNLWRRLTMGLPIITLLPDYRMDGDILDTYVQAQAAVSDFHLIDLVITIRPDEGSTITELEVGVDLYYRDSVAEENRPIAWSLVPGTESTPTPVSDQADVKVKLGISELGLSRKIDSFRYNPSVESFGERESAFEWRFTATAGHPLIGKQRMYAVVMADKGKAVQANLAVAAAVRVRSLGSISYRAQLDRRYATVATSQQQ